MTIRLAYNLKLLAQHTIGGAARQEASELEHLHRFQPIQSQTVVV